MISIAYLFRSSPHSLTSGREGVDALLAASAFTDDIGVFFLGDGVYQLLKGQQTNGILSKDYAPMFKLFDLYDIEQILVCQKSLEERGLSADDLLIEVKLVDSHAFRNNLAQARQVLTF